MKRINVGTVFSGIGSPEQALVKLGCPYNIVFACDNGERELPMSIDEVTSLVEGKSNVEKEELIRSLYAQRGENLMEKSYKANYKIDDDCFYQDIRFLDGSAFRSKIDLLVGGSPCQAFSCNGKRGGFEDTRGTLFYDYARLIRDSQPKAFIFENVRGMLNHDKGRTWETVKNVFRELNYNIYLHNDVNGNESPLLNAADYGIPQLRLRIFMVGIRKDITLQQEFTFPKPVKLEKTTRDYLEESVPAKYYLAQKGFEFVTTHPTRAQVNLDVMTCQKANQQFNWNGTFIFEPLSEKHTRDILKRAYVGEWQGVRGVCRMYTPRECLRLMGFPDTFRIVVNDHTMWRQSGNSMVVNVLELIMKELFNTGVFNV